jgi:hypothetical protein
MSVVTFALDIIAKQFIATGIYLNVERVTLVRKSYITEETWTIKIFEAILAASVKSTVSEKEPP